ncbi:MAG: DUF6249 domain-containing protein [Bacteroidota bacterium]
MAAAILVPTGFFLTIFGIVYLFLSTRHKERLALIEKGADANIFVRTKGPQHVASWKIVLINLGILLISAGLAIFIASALVEVLNVYEVVAYFGTIMIFSGIGLLVGFRVTKTLEPKA